MDTYEEDNYLDIYNRKYDYEDMKLAIFLTEQHLDLEDYEDILHLLVKIKEDYNKEFDHLSFEERGYIQKYAQNWLNEHDYITKGDNRNGNNKSIE